MIASQSLLAPSPAHGVRFDALSFSFSPEDDKFSEEFLCFWLSVRCSPRSEDILQVPISTAIVLHITINNTYHQIVSFTGCDCFGDHLLSLLREYRGTLQPKARATFSDCRLFHRNFHLRRSLKARLSLPTVASARRVALDELWDTLICVAQDQQLRRKIARI